MSAAVEWVRSELSYVPGTTGVHLGSGRAAGRQGVPGFSAHLSLILLRPWAFRPATCRGTYIPRPTRDRCGRRGAEPRLDPSLTGGWWNHDPTNNTEINEQYVSVGFGRSYADVSPLKGIYLG